MNWKINLIVLFLFYEDVKGHDVTDDFIKWKSYFRLSTISENNQYGLGSYYRIKRNTKFTFKDLRLFAHQITSGDNFFKLRYKDSKKFIKFQNLYNFTIISFAQNEKIGLKIRSHGSQGVGYFLFSYPYGHINTEVSFSYDMMDHLNDTKKTSYIKMGLFWDNSFSILESKFEFESIYQISDVVDNDLSRIEVLFELYYKLLDNLNIIVGYEIEDYINQNERGYSYFISIGYKRALNIKL